MAPNPHFRLGKEPIFCLQGWLVRKNTVFIGGSPKVLDFPHPKSLYGKKWGFFNCAFINPFIWGVVSLEERDNQITSRKFNTPDQSRQFHSRASCSRNITQPARKRRTHKTSQDLAIRFYGALGYHGYPPSGSQLPV